MREIPLRHKFEATFVRALRLEHNKHMQARACALLRQGWDIPLRNRVPHSITKHKSHSLLLTGLYSPNLCHPRR